MITTQQLDTAELLYNCAQNMGLQPTWIRPDRLLAIATPMGEHYIYDAKGTMNSQLASNLTRNKLTTRLIMQRCGLPNIAFLNTANLAEAEQFLTSHKKIIMKPLTGTNSRDIHIVESPEQLVHVDLSQYILEKYIAGKELRYLILNNKVIGVHESQYGDSVAETRYLERISHPESKWDTNLMDIALNTASVLNLRYAAVDYLVDAKGEVYILEVNSSPGMKWFHAPTSGPKIDVARLFLETMLNDLHRQTLSTTKPLGATPLGRV